MRRPSARGRAARPLEDRRGVVLDAGLQPERTTLAWRRTSLAVTVGGLVALRVLALPLGGWGLAAGLGGTGCGLLLAVLGARRGRAVARALSTRPVPSPLPPSGALTGVLALVVVVGAAVCLAGVLVMAGRR